MIKKLSVSFVLFSFFVSFFIFKSAIAETYSDNLLTNPGAETGDFTGWTVVNGSGSFGFGVIPTGWEDDNTFVHSGDHSFASSDYPDSGDFDQMSQEVDLVSKGFTTNQLDANPTISIDDFVHPGWDCCLQNQYEVVVELRDANHNVISTFDTGVQEIDGGTGWTEISHTFSGYGPGVRYVYFMQKGKQIVQQWVGHNGAFFDDASVSLIQDTAQPSLISVATNDLDNSHSFSQGDKIDFTFSESMSTSTLTSVNADSQLSLPNSHTFGTTGNGMSASWNATGTVFSVILGSDSTLADGDTASAVSSVSDVAGNLDNTPQPIHIPVPNPLLTEVTPITSSTTAENAKYYFKTSIACSLDVSPVSDSGSGDVSVHVSGSPVPGSDFYFYLEGIQVGGTYSFNFSCLNSGGSSNTLNVGPFTIVPTIIPVSHHSSGHIVLGCKDPSASNYNYFSQNTSDLCKYGPVNNSSSTAATTTDLSQVQVSTSTIFLFTRDLSRGMSGKDVIALQQFLINQNFGPAAQKLSQNGASGYFGNLTKAALLEFQKAKGILPATGNFGPKTRAYLKSIGY